MSDRSRITSAEPLGTVSYEDFERLTNVLGNTPYEGSVPYQRATDCITLPHGPSLQLEGALEPFLEAANDWLPDTDLDLTVDTGLVLPGQCQRGGIWHFDDKHGPNRAVLFSDDLVTLVAPQISDIKLEETIARARTQRLRTRVDQLCRVGIVQGVWLR